MNTTKIKLTLLGICGLMFTPFAGHASEATLVSPNTVLFTIDFSFSDDLFDLEVPIVAEFGVDYRDRVDTVGYTVESEANESGATYLKGVVLSQSAIAGDRYQVPAKSKASFTLMVLASYAEPITTEQRAYITKLPYWLNERRTTVHQNQLDELDTPTFKLTK